MKLSFDLLTLKVVSESRLTWATCMPILIFLGLSVLELRPIYATDRRQTDRPQTDRQTDVKRHHCLMPPPPFFSPKAFCVTQKVLKRRFPLEHRPGPRWGSLRRSPDPLVGWRGAPLPNPHSYSTPSASRISFQWTHLLNYFLHTALIAQWYYLALDSRIFQWPAPQKFSARNAPVYNNATLLPLLSSCQ